MSAPLTRSGRQYVAAVRALLLFTVLLGLAYPLLMTGLAQLVTPGRADGSLITDGGSVVGSSLIGQGFVDESGEPLPQYFQSRPSASDWDGAASGGSNLGPNSEELAALVEERRAAVAALEGVDLADVPSDAVTTSASALDPHISPEYAAIQVDRVADAGRLEAAEVQACVDQASSGRDLGFIGEPAVEVLAVNRCLDESAGAD